MNDYRVKYVSGGDDEADNYEGSVIVYAQDEDTARMEASDLLKNRDLTKARVVSAEVLL